MFTFDKFAKSLQELNFRPLMISKKDIFKILKEPRFEKIGFYAVYLKTANVAKKVLTLRYILFDIHGNPYNFDGSPSSAKTTSYYLKQTGFALDDAGNTGFSMDRTDLNGIFDTDAQSILLPVENDYHYAIFSILDESVVAPGLTTRKFTIYYNSIETWRQGGGGPGEGSRVIVPVYTPPNQG